MRPSFAIAVLFLLPAPGMLMGRAAREGAAAPAPQARKLAGKWKTVYGEVAGQSVPVEALPAETMLFLTDGRWSWGINDGTWTTNDNASPRAVDLQPAGRGANGRQLGIFGVVGDTLTIVVAVPGDTVRPATLETSTADPVSSLYVFWRISK